jgi:D-beta-D-heptose 7-phosphate kinase/D-beta-D-heptose 1-phosphate adenosyltransferase
MKAAADQRNARENLIRGVGRLASARALVIGDIILDAYVWGDATRISPEAPVPVVEVREETRTLGGAANVVHNMVTLGARPLLCGVVGRDREGKEILNRLKSLGLSTGGVLFDPGRPTTVKTRVVARSQQVIRFDQESRTAVSSRTVSKFLRFVEHSIPALDVIVVSDYGKGMVTGPLMEGITAMAKKSDVPVALDPRVNHAAHYRGVDVMTPNHHEAGMLCGIEISDDYALMRAGHQLLETFGSRLVLITRGKDGMSLFEAGGEIHHIPTVARKVFDVTGAGDTVIATFSLGLAAALDPKAAAVIANVAAGIVVGEVGTSAVRAEDLKTAIARYIV